MAAFAQIHAAAGLHDAEVDENDMNRDLGLDYKDELVVVNVSGRRFEVWGRMLARSPSELLASLKPQEACPYYLKGRSLENQQTEYFFARRAVAFEAILMWMIDGQLIQPHDTVVHPRAWLDELYFFKIKMPGGHKAQEEHAAADPGNGGDGEDGGSAKPSTWQVCKANIWQITDGEGFPEEHPHHKASKVLSAVYTVVSMTILLASVALFIIETLPRFRQRDVTECNFSNNTACSTTHPECFCRTQTEDHQNPTIFIFECVFIAWFTIELLVRFVVSPDKKAFVKDPMNAIDLIAVLPFYIGLMLSTSAASSVGIVRVIRLVRVFRVFKLTRHSVTLQIFGQALYQSRHELLQLMMLLIIAIVLFSSAIFYCEYKAGASDYGEFDSIPASAWWAVVTMTTLGYGDMVPQTSWGKLVGACCAISGILVLALPGSVFLRNFNDIWDAHKNSVLIQEEMAHAGEVSKKTKDPNPSVGPPGAYPRSPMPKGGGRVAPEGMGREGTPPPLDQG